MPRMGSRPASSTRFKRQAQDGGMRMAIALSVVSLVLLTFSGREAGSGPISSIRNGFQLVTTPVRTIGSLATVPFQGLGNIFENLTADQATLQELKARNAELESRCAELEEQAASAERLQGLLELQDAYALRSTAARIISGSTDSWTATVTIDKGTLAGITVGMPVTTAGGVIGQTIQCGPTSSVVRLLTDEGSSVSAMIQSSRAQGMLTGSADGSVHLTLIGTDQTVEVGDSVVTSGLGGVFPKGLPLGRVSNVSRSSGALYLDIDISLIASAENFEEVLVITSLTEEQEATAEDIAAADSQDSVSANPDGAADDDESSEDEYDDYDYDYDEG